MSTRKWLDYDVSTFLDLYKEQECLWNTKIEDYKDKRKRKKAYDTIKNNLKLGNFTIHDIKNKIRIIRTTYSAELRKVLNTKQFAACPTDIYVPRLCWFTLADSFLRSVTVRKSTTKKVLPPKISSRRKPSLKWGNKDVIILLKFYKKLECLWNTKSPDYREKSKRDIAYRILRNSLKLENLSVHDVKNKIKGIRTTYSDELRKVINSQQVDSKEIYVPKLFWFKLADSFLRDVTERGKFISENVITLVKNDAADYSSFNYEDINEINAKVEDMSQNENSLPMPEKPATNDQYSTSFHLSNFSDENKEDEYDLFCRSLAIQLKKMPELEALQLMQRMQLMIFKKKQEINQINSRQPTQNLQNHHNSNRHMSITNSSPTSSMLSPSYNSTSPGDTFLIAAEGDPLHTDSYLEVITTSNQPDNSESESDEII